MIAAKDSDGLSGRWVCSFN